MRKLWNILLLLCVGVAYGQTTMPINDVAFRTYLQTNYPQTMSGNNLDSTAAASIMDTLNFSNLGIQSVDGLEWFSNCSGIIAENNAITSFPDLYGFPLARIFDLSGNQLSEIVVTGQQFEADILDISDNIITLMPDLFGFMSIRIVDGRNNLIEGFSSTFDNLLNLDSLFLENNKLSFEEMIEISGHPSFSFFRLFPQDSIGPGGVYNKPKTSTLDYYLDQDSSVFSSQYFWELNGQPWLTNQSPFVTIDTFGVFSVKMVNANISFNDTLYGKTFVVSEGPCIDFSQLSYFTEPIQCSKGGVIQFQTGSIQGGTPPYTYMLVSGSDTLSSTVPTFTGLTKTNYTLEVKDNTGCVSLYGSPIFLNKEPCNDNIITQDDPSFQIDAPGIAYIYDRSGKLINKFETPAIWNGRDLNQKIVTTGLYIIQVGEVVYKVTMVR